MSVHMQRHGSFDLSSRDLNGRLEQFSEREFSVLLRNEKLRSERSGVVFAYLKIFVSQRTLSLDKQLHRLYREFTDRFLHFLHGEDEKQDIAYFLGENKLGLLLPNTHPQAAKTRVEAALNRCYEKFDSEEGALFARWFRGLDITAYPISKVSESSCFSAKPVLIRDVRWKVNEGSELSSAVDTVKLVLDWNLPNPELKKTILDNDIIKDSSLTVHQWQYKYVKRAFDFVASSLFILSLSLPMLIIASIVKLTSKGPVLFKQERIGQFGKRFQFYKFRSMRANADTKSHEEYVKKLIRGELDEINNGTDEAPMYKMVDDPRITSVGKILRRTSLDEIPQFFNVLKGDMSLVGPRPPIPYEVEEYEDWHLRRVSDVKPGITGLWQVLGRNSTTFDEMVRFDIDYVDHWTLMRDIKILILTVQTVLNRTGN